MKAQTITLTVTAAEMLAALRMLLYYGGKR